MFYAAYGSNLHPVRLSARILSARLLGTAAVSGWTMSFNKKGDDGSAKCNIRAADAEIHVAVYEVDRHGKIVLDAIEGVGFGYRTLMISVPGFGSCHTYIAAQSHIEDELQPYSWYKQLVLTGCEALDFPRDYIAGVQAVEAVSDPDGQRHAANWAIVEHANNNMHEEWL